MASPEYERLKRHRQRKRNGIALLSIEVALDPLRELLLDHGFLGEWDDGDRGKITRALELAIEVWSRR
jgi:hypothetical protein